MKKERMRKERRKGIVYGKCEMYGAGVEVNAMRGTVLTQDSGKEANFKDFIMTFRQIRMQTK